MKITKLIALASALVLFSPLAHARVFDFKNESLATYFRGSYGFSNLGGSAFEKSSGNSISTDKQVASAASGEFGFLLSAKHFNLLLGAEYLIPRALTEIEGKNIGGTRMFLLNSSVSAFIPMLNIEFLLSQGPTSKFFFGGGPGLAIVSFDNVYTMTAAGTAQTSISDHTESGTAQSLGGQAYIGYEALFTDTVTVAFDLGYRYYKITGFTSTKGTQTFSGTQTPGSNILNMNGTPRTMDLSGVFAGISCRFYLGL